MPESYTKGQPIAQLQNKKPCDLFRRRNDPLRQVRRESGQMI